MSEGYFEGVESKYDGITVACFYSSMGLNRELFEVKLLKKKILIYININIKLIKDYQTAYTYHKKALERW